MLHVSPTARNGLLATVLAGALLLGAGPAAPAAQAQGTGCQFVLGFATLRTLIGAQAVGNCLEDQRFAANGNAEQQTTGGLLVWRKADNWTAYTDGFRTWLNGPQGLQQRLNTARFAWEADAVPMQGNRFVAAEKVIPVGASLTWVNLDPEEHDVVANDLRFESPLVKPGESWSFTFTQPGTYPYVCTVHDNMAGVVTVTPEAGG